jgi:hypothetical protein
MNAWMSALLISVAGSDGVCAAEENINSRDRHNIVFRTGSPPRMRSIALR